MKFYNNKVFVILTFSGDIEAVKSIIADGQVYVNLPDSYGYTAIHFASLQGHN